MKLRCAACEHAWPWDPTRWRCECGGVLQVIGVPPFDPHRVDGNTFSVWRYQAALPLPLDTEPVTLGEGWTPLIEAEWEGRRMLFKAEYLNPTGSFKDRGATVLVTALKVAGIEDVVEDSSGNAGAALAAYAARGGLQATIYVPAHASPVKQAQIAVYGAQIVPVEGSRSRATRAVRRAVEEGAVYASHAYSPLFSYGMKSMAFELWEQLDGQGPDTVVVPVGHGGLLLGLFAGFSDLLAAGLIERLPRLCGVQASACAPVARAWQRGEETVSPAEEQDTVAGGVRIADPPWGRLILAAIRDSGGSALALPDDEILAAQRNLAQRGIYVEPTSALVGAALDYLRESLGQVAVGVLTGSGFKTPPGGSAH